MSAVATLSADVAREAARGQWRGTIYPSLGINVGNGKHGSCPACGGKDRFRCDDKDGSGSWYCNQCDPHAGDGFALVMKVRGCDFPEALGLVSEVLHVQTNGTSHKLGKLVAVHDFTDENGGLLFQECRFEPKTFRLRRPDGKGGWSWTLGDAPRVFYRLLDILQKPDALVVVHEGPGCVDAAIATDLPGVHTTSSGGANAPHKTDFSPVKGRDVVICPDNDEPGEKYFRDVADLAHKAGVKSVKVLRLPNLPPKGDVVDWLKVGGTPEQFAQLLEQAESIETAPLSSKLVDHAGVLPLTSLGELLNEPEESKPWLVENRLLVGGLSLLCGKPKAGKSTLTRTLALTVSLGRPWLGMPTVQGTVFYLALEEKRSQVRRHFKMMGATGDEAVHIFCAPSPVDGLTQLRAATERYQPALVIVDPLFRFTRVRDCNDYAAVTSALEPLLILARETNAHVLAVHHLGKGERDGGDAILGSTAIFAAVDTALLLKRSEKYRTLSSIQRYGEDLEEVTLNMDPDTGLITIGPSRKEAEEETVAGLILDYLGTQTEPVEESTIQENIESRKGIKVKALRRLVEEKKVTRGGVGKKGNPYVYLKAGFLVPPIKGEPENQKAKADQTPCHLDENAGSQLCAGSEKGAESAEPEIEEVIADEN